MSQRKWNRRAEDQAGALVAWARGARARRVDVPGAGDGLRDFDLVFEDGSIEPLEVTTDAHAPTRTTSRRAERSSGRSVALGRTWLLGLPRGTPSAVDVERCLREAVPALRLLETYGVHSLSDADWHPAQDVRRAAAGLEALGIDGGTSTDAENGKARIDFAVMYGGELRVDDVADAVERATGDVGNRRKLREPRDARLRHIFVNLDWSSGDAGWAARLAVDEQQMPRLPRLPEPVTTAWVRHGTAILTVTPPGEWVAVPLPDDFEDCFSEWLV